RRGAPRTRFAAAHRQAQGGHPGELEAWRGRDHRRLGVGRGRQEDLPAGLEGAASLYPYRAPAALVVAHWTVPLPACGRGTRRPSAAVSRTPPRRGGYVGVRGSPPQRRVFQQKPLTTADAPHRRSSSEKTPAEGRICPLPASGERENSVPPLD